MVKKVNGRKITVEFDFDDFRYCECGCKMYTHSELNYSILNCLTKPPQFKAYFNSRFLGIYDSFLSAKESCLANFEKKLTFLEEYF